MGLNRRGSFQYFNIPTSCHHTCRDDVTTSLEGLVIEVVLFTQCQHDVHRRVAQVHLGDGRLEGDGGEQRGGAAGACPLHCGDCQAVVNLEEARKLQAEDTENYKLRTGKTTS